MSCSWRTSTKYCVCRQKTSRAKAFHTKTLHKCAFLQFFWRFTSQKVHHAYEQSLSKLAQRKQEKYFSDRLEMITEITLRSDTQEIINMNVNQTALSSVYYVRLF